MKLDFLKKMKTGKAHYEDIEKLYSMLRLKRFEKRRGKMFVIYEYIYWYKGTGDCMNYEDRPAMCSDYPYGGKCVQKGCTYKN